jgi:hypothetical protein
LKRHLTAGVSVALGIIAIAGAEFAGARDPVAGVPLSSQYAGIEGSAGNIGGTIPRIPILDALGRQEVPLANGKWTKTGWTTEIGGTWRAPWHGYGATLSHHAGAYWDHATFSDLDGPVIVAATLGTGPIKEAWSNEFLSLWLDMPNPGRNRSGYEVRFMGAHRRFNDYTVELSRWVSGHRTVLAKRWKVSLPVNTTFALSETVGNLVVWTGTRRMTPILSTTDSTYSAGYVGVEANRGEGTAYNFRAGNVAE